MGWACNEKRRGLRGKKIDGFRSTVNKEEGQAKATMNGQKHGGGIRQERTQDRAVEATCRTRRPHVKWDNTWKNKKKKTKKRTYIRGTRRGTPSPCPPAAAPSRCTGTACWRSAAPSSTPRRRRRPTRVAPRRRRRRAARSTRRTA